jgi:hypothetical protein
MQTIKIVNPRPGGAKYTSIRAALKYVKQKIARMTERNELFFYDNVRRIEERVEAKVAIEKEHARLNGIVLWNGEDGSPVAMHRPGEVRC